MIEQDDLGTRFDEWEWVLANGSFEDVFETLEVIVARLEDAHLPLAESLACYELGVRLAERCERFLNEAELRVSRLDGSMAELTAIESPFDDAELDP